MRILLSIAAFAVLYGCATPNQYASKPKEISYEEAATFERSLLARAPIARDKPEPPLYTQPVNKKEACKLATSPGQLDRKNFRAYWDGECKNGFAFGLGRDISISDTHHYDEITIHDGNGGNSLQPSAFYNYVDNEIVYSVSGSKDPASANLMQRMLNTVSGFEMNQKLLIMDESGNTFEERADPFSTERIFINTPMGQFITYVIKDRTAMPLTNPNAANFVAEILDPRDNFTPGGVAVVQYGNGNVRHFKVDTEERIILPKAYSDHLWAKYQEVLNARSQASASLERAKQIEREYLFKACNGKSGIQGLDDAIYTKICNWRDQFKEPYATASAKFQQHLNDLRQQAATAEQNDIARGQIAQQQQEQQQQQQQMLLMQQIQRASSQPVINIEPSYQPRPFVNPFAEKPRVVCTHIGNQSICK